VLKSYNYFGNYIQNQLPHTYILMRLPISLISKNYEDHFKSKIKKYKLPIKIRRAKEIDIESTYFIHRESTLKSDDLYSQITIEALNRSYKDYGATIFIASFKDIDVGFIILEFEGDVEEYGVVSGINVLPQYQHRGIGKRLCLSAWNYFKQKDIIEIRCEVCLKNYLSYTLVKTLGFEEYRILYY